MGSFNNAATAVAAVAAVNLKIASEALDLVEIEKEKLPFVIDVDEAMKIGAPVVHSDRKHENVPINFSDNVTSFCSFGHGDLDAGFKEADEIVQK